MGGEQELALAVLMQAEKDANIGRNCYYQLTARNFLCGVNKEWKESLDFWCSLARKRTEYILDSSRRKWRPDLLKGGKNGRTN